MLKTTYKSVIHLSVDTTKKDYDKKMSCLDGRVTAHTPTLGIGGYCGSQHNIKF